MKNLIAQGAEAKIYLNKEIVSKERIPKTYRHPALDTQIRTRRTKSEAKLLTTALEKAKVNIPKVISTDKFNIHLEFIEGDKLSETLNKYKEKKQFEVMKQLGTQVAKLHKNNIIHGDLTTSNVILSNAKQAKAKKQNKTVKETTGDSKSDGAENSSEAEFGSGQLFTIDFGLGFISTRIEDKAVDLHLIKQALEAKHWQNHEQLFKQFLKGYKQYSEIDKVLAQLESVESRGRYKH